MDEIKYNDKYFKKIIKLSKKGLYQRTIVEYHKYLKNYPEDIIAYIFLTDTYLKLGDVSNANIIFQQAEILINNNTSYLVIEKFLIIKTKLLFYQNKFHQSYETFQQYANMFSKVNIDIYITDVFFKKLFSMPITYFKFEGYLVNQIYSYSSKRALEHIKKHQNNYQDNVFQFTSDFPVEKIFYQIRHYLSLNICYYNEIITNIYTFKYIANGHVDTHLVDYIEVVTLHNSQNIITMYPSHNKARRPFIDLTPNFDNYKLQRIKQAEKFINKYGEKYRKK